MKRIFAALFIGAVFLSPAIAQAQVEHFLAPNGTDPVPVSAANPLPVTPGAASPTAANQVTANTALGAPGDTVCSTATGTCSIEALLKYLGSGPMPNAGGCTSVIPISQTASTDLHTSSGKTYICAILIVAPDAEVVSLVEGTGSVCATGIAAIIGSTTAANGTSLAANGGYQMSSSSPVFNTQTASDHLCLLQSGSGRVAGFISYNDH
jgi:hypothetical protein